MRAFVYLDYGLSLVFGGHKIFGVSVQDNSSSSWKIERVRIKVWEKRTNQKDF